jgi:hypothetical protein
MKKIIRPLLTLFFFWILLGFTVGQPVLANDYETLNASIMRPDPVTLMDWIKKYKEAPKADIKEDIQNSLMQLQESGIGASRDLSSYLPYNQSNMVQRNQGSCGNCWNWAGTGVLEIAHSKQNGVSERLSPQFLNSCKTDRFACCGGTLEMFATWYSQQALAIPWNNTNAGYVDGSRECPQGTSSRACSTITKTPNYPITSISPVTIDTSGGQNTAINNVKNILNQDKAIWFGFFLPTQAAWDNFINFWNTQTETAVWDPGQYCGTSFNNQGGGGHAVVLLGYNDDNPSNPYWILLNSWGTANGNRPNGIFRMKMNTNYDCQYPYGGYSPLDAFIWQTLSVQFAGGGTCTYSVNPSTQNFSNPGGSGTINITTQTNCNWSASKNADWITFTSQSSGSGSGIVTYSVSINTGGQRTGTITIAGKTTTITQNGTTSLSNLLQNPGFEDGESAWENTGWIIWWAPCYTGIDCAFGGEWLAWLGGYDDAYDQIYQDVTIPSDATKATLKFMYAIETDDIGWGEADYLDIYVTRLRDNYRQLIDTYSNLNYTPGWVESQTYNISSFIGEAVRSEFIGTTDYALITNFFIDDVVLSIERPGAVLSERLYLPLILK